MTVEILRLLEQIEFSIAALAKTVEDIENNTYTNTTRKTIARENAYMARMPSEGKVLSTGPSGIVTAIVNLSGARDYGMDIVKSGAWGRINASDIRILDHHQSKSVTDIIGKAISVEEVGRDQLPALLRNSHPKATGGLRAEMQFAINDSEKAAAIFRLIDSGWCKEWSVGFDVVTHHTELSDGFATRVIEKAHLWEISPVIWGASYTETIDSKARGETPLRRAFRAYAEASKNWQSELEKIYRGRGDPRKLRAAELKKKATKNLFEIEIDKETGRTK